MCLLLFYEPMASSDKTGGGRKLKQYIGQVTSKRRKADWWRGCGKGDKSRIVDLHNHSNNSNTLSARQSRNVRGGGRSECAAPLKGHCALSSNQMWQWSINVVSNQPVTAVRSPGNLPQDRLRQGGRWALQLSSERPSYLSAWLQAYLRERRQHVLISVHGQAGKPASWLAPLLWTQPWRRSW